jgi:hypothetical protein
MSIKNKKSALKTQIRFEKLIFVNKFPILSSLIF